VCSFDAVVGEHRVISEEIQRLVNKFLRTEKGQSASLDVAELKDNPIIMLYNSDAQIVKLIFQKVKV
jgi:hypothetical protein